MVPIFVAFADVPLNKDPIFVPVADVLLNLKATSVLDESFQILLNVAEVAKGNALIYSVLNVIAFA